jgi:hypothetical protein
MGAFSGVSAHFEKTQVRAEGSQPFGRELGRPISNFVVDAFDQTENRSR